MKREKIAIEREVERDRESDCEVKTIERSKIFIATINNLIIN